MVGPTERDFVHLIVSFVALDEPLHSLAPSCRLNVLGKDSVLPPVAVDYLLTPIPYPSWADHPSLRSLSHVSRNLLAAILAGMSPSESSSRRLYDTAPPLMSATNPSRACLRSSEASRSKAADDSAGSGSPSKSASWPSLRSSSSRRSAPTKPSQAATCSALFSLSERSRARSRARLCAMSSCQRSALSSRCDPSRSVLSCRPASVSRTALSASSNGSPVRLAATCAWRLKAAAALCFRSTPYPFRSYRAPPQQKKAAPFSGRHLRRNKTTFYCPLRIPQSRLVAPQDRGDPGPFRAPRTCERPV